MWMVILQIVMAMMNPQLWKAVGDIWDRIRGLPSGPKKTELAMRFKRLVKNRRSANGALPVSGDNFDALRKELGM